MVGKDRCQIGRPTDTRWDDLMFDQRFFNYFAFFITPIVIRMVSFQIGLEYLVVINKVIDIWIVLRWHFCCLW